MDPNELMNKLAEMINNLAEEKDIVRGENLVEDIGFVLEDLHAWKMAGGFTPHLKLKTVHKAERDFNF